MVSRGGLLEGHLLTLTPPFLTADEDLLLLEVVQQRRVEDNEEEMKDTAVSLQSPPSVHKQDTKVHLPTCPSRLSHFLSADCVCVFLLTD